MLPTVAACSKSHVTLASRATLMTGWLVALVDLHVSENAQAESHSEELNLPVCPGQVCISFVFVIRACRGSCEVRAVRCCLKWWGTARRLQLPWFRRTIWVSIVDATVGSTYSRPPGMHQVLRIRSTARVPYGVCAYWCMYACMGAIGPPPQKKI